MSFWRHMLTQTVDLEPFDSLGTDGSVTYGAIQSDVPARVEREITESHGSDGTVEDTVTTVWLTEEVSEGDKIHLPGGDEMKVSAVESDPSVDGSVTLYQARG